MRVLRSHETSRSVFLLPQRHVTRRTESLVTPALKRQNSRRLRLQAVCRHCVSVSVCRGMWSYLKFLFTGGCYAELVPIMVLVFPDVSALCNLIKMPVDCYRAPCHDNVLDIRMVQGELKVSLLMKSVWWKAVV
jgi:hypothetical protein